MTEGSKILTGLMDRRALEAQFSALLETADPGQADRLAGEIAGRGGAALSMLLAKLDTDDPRVRARLGQVAQRLDRDQVVAALRKLAGSRDRSDQIRLSALTVLQRYLDEPADDSLLTGIQDPAGAALRSLGELVQAMDQEPAAIIEYLTQLADQPSEVAFMILDAVPRMPFSAHLVTLVRMLGQDESQPLARSAIEQLGRTRAPEALLALETLVAVLPPPTRALAERSLRKLRMSGVRPPAPGAEAGGRRTLISPVDGSGAQVIHFIGQPADGDPGRMLTVVTRDPDGIVACIDSANLPADRWQPSQPPGRVFTSTQEDGTPGVELVEVSYGEGRSAVRRALELNWAGGAVPPLEYRWLNPLIWGTDDVETAEPAPEPGPFSAPQTAAILDHPTFSTWFWWSDALFDVARRSSRPMTVSARDKKISALASAHFNSAVIASYQRRLLAMARWLASADQPQAAALAISAAAHLADSAPAESPFVRRLIGIGLDVVIASLQANRI